MITKMSSFLFLLALPGTFMACKSRSFNLSKAPPAADATIQTPLKLTEAPKPKQFNCQAPTNQGNPSGTALSIGPKPLYAYHWTDDTTALETSSLQKWLTEKFESAKTVSLEDSPNALGEGLYLSATPLITSGLGRILVAVPLKENCSYQKMETTDWETSPDDQKKLESDAALILFSLDDKENKMLVRSADGVHMNLATALDTRSQEGTPLEKNAPISLSKPGDWKTGIQHFGSQFSFFGSAFTKSKGPLLVKDNSLTNEGWLFALQAELASGGAQREQRLDSAIASNQGEIRVCTKTDSRFTHRGSKHYNCVVELFEFITSHLSPQLSADATSVAMELNEARAILFALGYGSILDTIQPQKSASTSLSKTQIKQELSKFFVAWQAVPGKAATAVSLLKASLFFAGGETEKDLDSLP